MDPPDTPTPAPRLRRSPARQTLHEEPQQSTNQVLRPTIRLVPNEDDVKVYATSPFPTANSQVLAPGPRDSRAYVPAPPAPAPVPSTATAPAPPALDANPFVTTSLTQSVTSRPHQSPSSSAINLLPPRRNHSSNNYGSIADTLAAASVADSSFNTSSSTPITPQSFIAGERYTPSSVASSLDVDRRSEMERGLYGPEQGEQYSPNSPDSPNNEQHQDYSTPSDFSSSQPPSSDRPQYARPSAPTPSRTAEMPTPSSGAGLGVFASRASRLSEQGTPMSTISAGSSGTVVHNRTSQIATPAGYYRLFPPSARQPGSTRSARSSSDPPHPLSIGEISPPSSGSPGSPVSPMSPQPQAPHSIYSTRAHARSDTALETIGDSVRIPVNQDLGEGTSRQTSEEPDSDDPKYFTIGRPVSSRSRDPNRWTLALSTVLSEGTREDSSSFGGREHSNGHRSYASSSQDDPTVPNFPLPETAKQRQRRHSSHASPSRGHIREVSVEKDLPPLPEIHGYGPQTPTATRTEEPATSPPEEPVDIPKPLRVPQSIYHRPYDRHSQIRDEAGNRDSGTSFTTREFRETLPPWAKSYYAHEARNRATIGARPTSHVPQNSPTRQHRHTIGSPRAPQRSSLRVSNPRPGRADRESFYRDSMAISPVYESPSYGVHQSNLEYRHSRLHPHDTDWSPHLYYDRRSAINRRTVWVEPSIDLKAEGNGLSRRNVQVWMFAVGFVMPLAWIVASFLPLPPRVSTPPSSPGFERDLEKAFGPRDQARYENARWWRNINRMMSVLGWLIIVALVVLVVVAATRPEDITVT